MKIVLFSINIIAYAENQKKTIRKFLELTNGQQVHEFMTIKPNNRFFNISVKPSAKI